MKFFSIQQFINGTNVMTLNIDCLFCTMSNLHSRTNIADTTQNTWIVTAGLESNRSGTANVKPGNTPTNL